MVDGLKSVKERLINQVNKDFLMEFTQNIAKEVRLSGTEEELRSFKYVQNTLEGFGIETTLEFSDGYISLPGAAQLKVNGQSFKCITHAMSVPTSSEGLEAQLVYVSELSKLKDPQEAVKGKIVILDGLATPGAVQLATLSGAIGALFINAKYTHEMIVSPVWGNPTTETANKLPSIPVVSVNIEDGSQIKTIVEVHDSKAWIKTEVDTRWRKIPVLTAEVKGTEEPDKFVLFSGHIDSWHYGAMDNGSANATMIEVARILNDYRHELKRTLRLAFWSGHSHGRYAGSAWYCDENWEDLHDNCLMHINIDSVGGKGATILSEGNCMSETKHLAAKTIKALTEVDYEGSRFGRAGDQSFWGPGVPSLFMGLSEQPQSTAPAAKAFSQLFGAGKGGGFGWWWHTTEDTVDKLDPDNLERDCKIYTSIVYEACANTIYPINQLETVKEIKEFILNYKQKAEAYLDFTRLVDRIETLEAEISKFYNIVNSDAGALKSKQVNETIMALSKVLVPLNYVNGNSFQHDPALAQGPIPMLAKANQFVNVEKNSNLYFQLVTELKRNINQVNFALREAIEICANANSQLQE